MEVQLWRKRKKKQQGTKGRPRKAMPPVEPRIRRGLPKANKKKAAKSKKAKDKTNKSARQMMMNAKKIPYDNRTVLQVVIFVSGLLDPLLVPSK